MRIRLHGRTLRVHRVDYRRNLLLVYGWRDVVAHEVTVAEVVFCGERL